MTQTYCIHVIGGGLYGCLTAWQIKRLNPSFKVVLLEAADHLMSAFDSISIDGVELNNGFHGIEIPRAEALLNFFQNELSVDFIKTSNERLLSIGGELLPADAPLAEYPTILKKNFKTMGGFQSDVASDFWSVISPEYMETLKKIGHRYSDHIENYEQLLIPWFFPADYVLNSSDEGEKFRNQVKSHEIKAGYGIPAKSIFSVLQPAIKKCLEACGVEIRLSVKVDFKKDNFRYTDSDGGDTVSLLEADKVFYCASSALILRTAAPEIFSQLSLEKRYLANALMQYEDGSLTRPFSEILCCDLRIPELARISQPTSFCTNDQSNENLIQAELFFLNKEEYTDCADLITQGVARVLNPIANGDLKIRGLKVTRQVYFPARQDLLQANSFISIWASQFKNFHYRNIYGPINMSKAWLWSLQDAELV